MIPYAIEFAVVFAHNCIGASVTQLSSTEFHHSNPAVHTAYSQRVPVQRGRGSFEQSPSQIRDAAAVCSPSAIGHLSLENIPADEYRSLAAGVPNAQHSKLITHGNNRHRGRGGSGSVTTTTTITMTIIIIAAVEGTAKKAPEEPSASDCRIVADKIAYTVPLQTLDHIP